MTYTCTSFGSNFGKKLELHADSFEDAAKQWVVHWGRTNKQVGFLTPVHVQVKVECKEGERIILVRVQARIDAAVVP